MKWVQLPGAGDVPLVSLAPFARPPLAVLASGHSTWGARTTQSLIIDRRWGHQGQGWDCCRCRRRPSRGAGPTFVRFSSLRHKYPRSSFLPSCRLGPATPSPLLATPSTCLVGSTRRVCPSVRTCMLTTWRSARGASCRCEESVLSSCSVATAGGCIRALLCCSHSQLNSPLLPGARHAAAAAQCPCGSGSGHRPLRVWRALRHRDWGGSAE